MNSLLNQPTNTFVKKPTIVFCLPGRSFSNKFLLSWSELLTNLTKMGYNILISQKYTSNVYYVRNMCLGGDVMRGINQKPFDGKVNYDYIMWIDSDIVFSTQQFLKLLQHNKPIVSGLYLMDGGKQYATVKDWDIEFFKKNSYFEFLTPDSVNKWKTNNPNKLMEVEYTGFGFLLCKKGVFESIKYPWFEPIYEKNISNNVVDFCSEDVSFCKKILKKGYKIYIDPNIVVGHEKHIIY
jgi:hypothetical protein